jgi:acyl-[acyl-carrier-protein]-phospholipid O-acyltransferase/long-chain-fatty-acid--[acyl-carrier-protein] ligase
MKNSSSNWLKLFLTNLFTLLNDNYLKNIIYFVGVTWTLPEFLSDSLLLTLISAMLVIPYLLFTPLSGRLAVIFSKQKVYMYCKLCEFPIILLACIALITHSIFFCILSVFFMGVQSCLSSPSKYGIIRDIEGEEKIAYGNGMMEMMSFVGILLGTILGTMLSELVSIWIICALMLLFTTISFITVYRLKIVEIPSEKPIFNTINPIKYMIESFRFAQKYKGINDAVLGSSIFWMIAGMLQLNLVIHCRQTLELSNIGTGLCMSSAAVGIALGCVWAGKILRSDNAFRMINIGLLAMNIFLLLIIIFNPNVYIFSLLMFGVTFFGGIFEVPCLAIVQRAPIGRIVGDMMAYLNFANFVLVLIGTAIFYAVSAFSNENSIAIFTSVEVILFLSLIYFIFKFRK